MNYEILSRRVINYHLSLQGDNIALRTFQDRRNGFLLFECNSPAYKVILHSADNSYNRIENLISSLHADEESCLKNIYDILGGVFQVFVWNKTRRSLRAVCDYLGVGGVLHMRCGNSRTVIFANYSNLAETGEPLVVSRKGLVAHFGLGYHVDPFDYVFKGIAPFKGGVIYQFQGSDHDTTRAKWREFPVRDEQLAAEFWRSVNGNVYGDNVVTGATAGKDSLVIMSSLDRRSRSRAGAFGGPGAGDVMQGRMVAEAVGLEFSNLTICDEAEFRRYAELIACFSGGLATCSYVDMMKFVDRGIPRCNAYLMGEGGESIRQFFPEGVDDIAEAMHDYITPVCFLKSCMGGLNSDEIRDYPQSILTNISEWYRGANLSETMLNFYRFGRMPGNFSNRHRIVNSVRDKCAPFLGSDFMKMSYGLGESAYKNSGVHRKIIERNNNDLLRFFEQPVKGDGGVQDWGARLSGGIGRQMIKMLDENIDAVARIFDKKETMALVSHEIASPSRGVYFLLRVLSLTLFLGKQKNYDVV